jgi:ATP-dependent DNA helicase RecG
MDIKYLKGVGEKRAEAFKKIGINDLEDFLSFIPRAYMKKIRIREVSSHMFENVIIMGKVIDIHYPSKSNHPLVVSLHDGSGSIEIPIFGGSEFRSKQFRLNEEYLFSGKISESWSSVKYKFDYRDHIKLNPIDPIEKEFLKFKFFPVYELSGILKKTWIKPLLLSKIVFNAFYTLFKDKNNHIAETLPENILQKHDLISKKEAVIRINFPKELDDAETARKRLAFEELFYLELILALKKRSIQIEKKGISFNKDISSLTEKFKRSLPYELTSAQKKVINEIYTDMRSGKCMNRLLQGDVGSGKTIVALFSMLIAIENGYQCAFMCPTELLAEQHYFNISKLVEPFEVNVKLLIGGQKKKLREEIYNEIKTGMANIVIGTHALIQEKVEFKNLGFVVIDEQHKFGVMQRAKLKDKGLNPDVLVMTATPIPRTLSLTYYGDLDVSVIDELPGNRIKIKTALRTDDEKQKIYKFVKDEVKKGRQVYIVFPVIEESETSDIKSAEKNFELLKKNVFPGLNIDMIHGRLLWYEKDEVMENFKEGKIKILVTTTVIEVGIDIPNATIMIIEDAHRFGLSQLHQLRGRVGRGADQSYCILIAKKNLKEDETSFNRLKVLCETTDGFKIAEEDMKLRGPGEFFGIRQSGVLNFSCTDLNKDKDVLEKAREIAFDLIDKDPNLRKSENEIIRKTFLNAYKDSLYLMEIA